MILMDLARSMGASMDFASSGAILEEIAGINPLMAGISYPRIDHRGIAWPCPNARHPGTPRLYAEGFRNTRAAFFTGENAA